MSEALAGAVIEVATTVPAGAVRAAAAAIEGEPAWSASAARRLVSADPAGGAALRLEEVAVAWAAEPSLPGVAVAAALRAAVGAVARQRAEVQVELVWTGPPSDALGLRSTRAVLNELVARATKRLLLVSYAAYDVDDLVVALADAATRGVKIDLVLETKADGGLTVDAAEAFHALRGAARFYRWPVEQREAAVAGSARLHAKCAIRDAAEVFVSSANFTGAAINDNIELGVLVRSRQVAARLGRHFELLVESGVLVTAPPHAPGDG